MDDSTNKQTRIIAIPSDRAWFDPRLLSAATQIVRTDTPVVAGVDTQFLPINTRRILLIIPTNLNIGAGSQIAPWPINGGPYLDAYQATGPLRYSLFDYPGIVTNAWWINNFGGGTITTIEVLRS